MPQSKRTPFRLLIALLLVLSLLLTGYGGGVAVMKTLYPLRYTDFVEIYTKAYGLEKSFILAVMKCESGFDPQAVSNVGARGLMQIMPETFTWLQTKTGETLDSEALFDPAVSVRYGCLFYQILLRQFSDERVAVCAYHAGIGNVKRWLKDARYSPDGKTLSSVPFSSTAHYAAKVMRVKHIYERLYNI